MAASPSSNGQQGWLHALRQGDVEEPKTYLRRFCVCNNVFVRKTKDARKHEAHLVLREWFAPGVMQDRRDRTR